MPTIIEKNRKSELRVQLKEYEGHAFVDTNADDRSPTKRGVTLAPAKIPDLIAALEAAQQEARELGLMSEKSDR